MARRSNAEKLAEVHARALLRFDRASEGALDGREEALQDRRFHSIRGAQWEGFLGSQFENRPKLEANVVDLAVLRVVNEYRMNRITVDFLSKEGDEYDELADLCDGLFRADEQDSRATEAYDNAFSEGAGGGFGAWRLTTEYEDEYDDEDDRQRIRIEPIYDADTCVFFDPGAKRYDKSDAKFAFVLEAMSQEAYEEEWGSADSGISPPVSETLFDWSQPDLVYVAEYYEIEEAKTVSYTYAAIDGEEEKFTEADFENDETLADTLNATGYKLVKEKPVKTRKVHKYIISGDRVLEDCGYIAGKHIPVVPFYGKRWYIEGVERFAGVVRHVKDMQRLKNMQISAIADISSRSSVPKPILAPEQVAGLEHIWANDAVENYAYLPLNPIADASGNVVPMGPVGYTQPAQIPQATAALLELSAVDIEKILGSQEAGEQIDTQLSGKAIELVQTRLDMQSYIYMSNMANSVRRTGEIWLSMASEVYVEEGRKMKYVSEDGTVDRAELGKVTLGADGVPVNEADMSKANFDVISDVGPTSSSRRSATVRAMTAIVPLVQNPQDQAVILATIMRNMEGEGIGAVREHFRKQLVQMGVEDPTDADKEEMAAAAQGQQPDPQAVLAQSLAAESQAKAQKAQADSVLAVARAKESEAKTAETLAGIDLDKQKQTLEVAKALRDTISGAGVPRPAVTVVPQ